MGLKELITAKLATGEAHSFMLHRFDSGLNIPNGQALNSLFLTGATWQNVALVGVWAAMSGAGRLDLSRVQSVGGTLTNAGGFNERKVTDMPSASGLNISWEIDPAGALGVAFNDALHLDLWESPSIIRNVASGGAIYSRIQNDSGAAKGYALSLQFVAWQ